MLHSTSHPHQSYQGEVGECSGNEGLGDHFVECRCTCLETGPLRGGMRHRGSVRGNVEGRRKKKLGTTRTKDEGFPLMVGQGGANLRERIYPMGRFG